VLVFVYVIWITYSEKLLPLDLVWDIVRLPKY